MRRIAIVLLLFWLLAARPASCANVTITLLSGSLTFAAVTLNGDLITNTTVTAVPVFQIVCTNVTNPPPRGWNVTLVSSNFVNATDTIPATSLTYTATGGTITRVAGQNVDPVNGPLETGNGGNLSVAIKCVTTTGLSGSGQGTYNWTPSSSQWSLAIPASALAGTYTGTLTATVASGP